MTALGWQNLPARLGAHTRAWAKRRQGTDRSEATLDPRRVYILPTRSGLLYGAAIIMLLVSSMNFSNNMGFALTFLLTAVAVVSMHHCQRNLVGLTVSMGQPESGFAGAQVGFRVRIHNPLPDWRMQIWIGWDRSRGGDCQLRPGGSQTIYLPLDAPHRGRIKAPRIRVSSVFPLGLFRAWSWLHMDAHACAWPTPGAAETATTTDDDAQDTMPAPQRNGDDLSGKRAYRRGDSLRRIDWKGLARHGELQVREFEDGGHGDLWLDWAALPGVEHERRLAVLTRLALDAHSGNRCWGLRLPDTHLAPASGLRHLHACLDALALFGIADEPREN